MINRYKTIDNLNHLENLKAYLRHFWKEMNKAFMSQDYDRIDELYDYLVESVETDSGITREYKELWKSYNELKKSAYSVVVWPTPKEFGYLSDAFNDFQDEVNNYTPSNKSVSLNSYRSGLRIKQSYEESGADESSYIFQRLIFDLGDVDSKIMKSFENMKHNYPEWKEELDFLYSELYSEFATLVEGFIEFNYEKFYGDD